MAPTLVTPSETRRITLSELKPNSFSFSIYGDPDEEAEDLVESVRVHGILVPLVVAPEGSGWEVISGHRRLACARRLGLPDVPCEIRPLRTRSERRLAVLEYNRQRRKSFSQLMREADALESLQAATACRRRLSNLRQFQAESEPSECRNSDARRGRTYAAIARALGLGGKDLYPVFYSNFVSLIASRT
jgi:ParB family chromosome partitioning protein